MAFGKWEKVEGDIPPEFSLSYYLSIKSEISSHLFPLMSKDEVAKSLWSGFFITIQQQNVEESEKSCKHFQIFQALIK